LDQTNTFAKQKSDKHTSKQIFFFSNLSMCGNSNVCLASGQCQCSNGDIKDIKDICRNGSINEINGGTLIGPGAQWVILFGALGAFVLS